MYVKLLLNTNNTVTVYNTEDPSYMIIVLPAVSVTVESDTTLSISWVEPSSLTHLPSDIYTVTVTPTCMNGDTAVFTPPPQMVAFDATPTLQVTNLSKLQTHDYSNLKQ